MNRHTRNRAKLAGSCFILLGVFLTVSGITVADQPLTIFGSVVAFAGILVSAVVSLVEPVSCRDSDHT